MAPTLQRPSRSKRCRARVLRLALWSVAGFAAFGAGTSFVGIARAAVQGRVRGRVRATALPTSRFHGVTWHVGEDKWQAHVEDLVTGQRISLGIFDSEPDAAKAFDCARLALEADKEVETNFPASSYTEREILEQAQRLKNQWRPRPSALYRGVYRTRGSTRWKAEIELYGVKQFLDFYDEEVEAARAVDHAVRSTGAERALRLQRLNFRQDSDYFDKDTWESEPAPRGTSSCFIGVSYHQASNKFLAKLGRKHVGLFDTELEAALAFDEASAAAGGVTNFCPAKQMS